MKKKRLIPFGLTLGGMLLKGRSRDEAEAHYYFDGEDLERRLIEISHPDDPLERRYLNLDVDLSYGLIDKYTYEIERVRLDHADDAAALPPLLLEIERRFNRISPYEYDCRKAALDHPEDDTERALALLEIDLNHGRLTRPEHDKKRASLLQEPWIDIIHSDYDARGGLNGLAFEFDWNDLWIEYLRLNGYQGVGDEQVVEAWFSDVCRTVADEHKGDGGAAALLAGRTANRVRGDGGTSSLYS